MVEHERISCCSPAGFKASQTKTPKPSHLSTAVSVMNYPFESILEPLGWEAGTVHARSNFVKVQASAQPKCHKPSREMAGLNKCEGT